MEIQFLKSVLILINILNTLDALDTSIKTDKKTTKWHIQESTTRTVHNLTNLIYRYYLVCGSEYICEKENYGFIKDHQPTSGLELCPRCSCDKGCVQNGTCCPDIMFSFPDPVCQDISIVNNMPRRNDQNYMIMKCHDESSHETKEKCYQNFTNAQLMQNPPVTSNDYAFTFRNKHCAECNGVDNYSNWGISISCGTVSDFNFLSTYEDIIDQAIAEHCNVQYEEDDGSSKHRCESTAPVPIYLIAECNTTGTWHTYDKDIATACNSSYHLEDKGFKNVFCLMCNPPLYNTDTISSCNVSGSWEPYDSALLDACTKYDATPTTMPYKNVFCFLCNRNNTSYFRYQDANAVISKIFTIASYMVKVQILEHDLDYYYSALDSSGLSNNDDVHTMSNKAVSLNKTKLLWLHYAMYGTDSYCSAKFPGGFFVNQTCLCDESCLFRHSEPLCCHDFLLNSTTSCLETLISGPAVFSSHIGAISGCNPLFGSDVTVNRCNSANVNDIFGILPVTYGNSVYKNLDCFRCNNPTINMSQVSPSHWEFLIECESYPHFNYFPTVKAIIEQAKRRNCRIQIVPENTDDLTFQISRIYCKKENIGRCNVTGHWSAYDSDIALACENLDIFLPPYDNFKNVYCYICNNPSPSSITEATCLVAAENQYYGENITTACAALPGVPGFGLYRNIFCKTCSIANAKIKPSSWIPYVSLGRGSIDSSIQSVRDLFIYHGTAMSLATRVLEVGNEENTILNKANNRIHNLTCFPGKTLVGNKCEPLLKYTENLLYVLSFSLEGYSSSPPEMLLLIVKGKIKSEIFSINNMIIFDSFNIAVNISCDASYNDSKGVRILVHTSIFITKKVNRLMTERRLINMTKENFNIDNSTFLKASPSLDAFLIPVVLKTLSFAHQCHIAETSRKSYGFEDTFHPAVVSDLLLCTHVVFQSQDFEIHGTDLSLNMGKATRSLNPIEYILIDTEARICLDVFHEINEEYIKIDETKSTISKALGTFELICTVISLVGLFLTFMTYCLFPVMRSIPGINNMNLVFVMFFAQLLFQVGFSRTSIPTLCATMGILIHFFWLSTFTCMNVCSFHMYSVFAGDLMSGRQTDKWKKRIMMYMLYSHGLPAAVIVLNIIILSSTSEDGRIGYGSTVCFVNNMASFYISFFVPVLLICVSNIYFFTRTAIKIRGTPKVESTQEKRNDFIIYVKLFSLTGITWILLVIDTLFTVSVFSFLVVFFTVCQGLFVFVSFVVNKRVLKHYVKLCCNKTKDVSRDNTTSHTTQSVLTNSSTV